MSGNPSIVAIYYQPPSDGVEECISVELIGRAKRFARFWPDSPDGIEWGWTLHDTAERIWPTQETGRIAELERVLANLGVQLTAGASGDPAGGETE